jgi:hypothetical protein
VKKIPTPFSLDKRWCVWRKKEGNFISFNHKVIYYKREENI